jgi:dolichol-phosphate mannosyltransferase
VNVVIVIPTYNEALNLGRIVPHIFAAQSNANIIIVDDNSPDGTGSIADALTARYGSRINVIHRPSKAGIGTAYIEGFKNALSMDADLILTMDADFSHDPSFIPCLINASNRADLVLGSRYLNGVRVEGWRFRRLLLSKLANIYVSHIMVKPVWDFTSGFRCYKRAVLERTNLDEVKSNGYSFHIEMTYLAFKHNFLVSEIPIIFKERELGFSKISRKEIWTAVLITLKCRAPLRVILRHLSFLFRDYSYFIEENHHLNAENVQSIHWDHGL